MAPKIHAVVQDAYDGDSLWRLQPEYNDVTRLAHPTIRFPGSLTAVQKMIGAKGAGKIIAVPCCRTDWIYREVIQRGFDERLISKPRNLAKGEFAVIQNGADVGFRCRS